MKPILPLRTALLLAPLAGLHGAETVPLAKIRLEVLAYCDALRVPGKPLGWYFDKPGKTGAPSLYASCDVVHMRTVMGEDLQQTLKPTQRQAWIDHINSFARPDGTYGPARQNHSPQHANGMVVGALGVLGGKQKHPVRLYDAFDSVEKAGPWLETVDWRKQWSGSHLFWGGMHCFSMSGRCTDVWRKAVFDWLDANLDLQTGWWRKGVAHAGPYEPLGGGAHIWPIYQHNNRRFPLPERVIDSILALQKADGAWLDYGNYMELDALYGLAYMSSLAPQHRRADILEAARRHGRGLIAQWPAFLAKKPDLHVLLGAVGAFGLLQQLLPETYTDTLKWTDIFSDARLYQTRRVEMREDSETIKARGDAGRYLRIVRAYADGMIEHGRDSYGEVHTPLFAEALDRRTMKLLAGDALTKARALTFEEWLIRSNDRMLTGANPMHCQNLYQVLYALTEITGEKRYATEADASLKYFFEHCQSANSGLFYWGEHAGWDLLKDAPIKSNTHEYFRPWVLWDRCWELAPEACKKHALGLWTHQITDHETGLYSRHAYIEGEKRYPSDAPYPRHGGFYVETWAKAYQHTKDDTFLKAIETMVDCQERLRLSGGMVIGGNIKYPGTRKAHDVSFAISLWQAAASLPEPLAEKLRTVAKANDLPPTEDVKPVMKSPNIWTGGYGGAGGQIAGPANLLLLRYGQTKPEQYRERILAVADIHLTSPVMLSFPLHPDIFGKVIHLLLGAHELTGDPRYLAKAGELADRAIELFLPDASPLPKASHQHDHYEAVTRGDSLMMSLLQLWAARQSPIRKLSLIYTDR